MKQIHAFVRDDVLPSWFANAIGFALSVMAHNFLLVRWSNTQVRIPASADDQAAILSIGGLWRWNEANLTVAHPGGAAGAYPIFVTAKAQQIDNTPAPYTDDTDYSFGAQISAPGAHPVIIPGAVDVYRQVGVVHWDGVKITDIDQSIPPTPLHSGSHAIGGTDVLTPADIGAFASTDPFRIYAPNIHSAAGGATDGSSVLHGRYKQFGALCFFAITYAVANPGFSGGLGHVTFDVPFPANEDQRVPCSLSTPGDGRFWPGVGMIDAGSDQLRPMFPVDDTHTDAQQLQNNLIGGPIPPTSVPDQPTGHVALEDGSYFVASGCYETM